MKILLVDASLRMGGAEVLVTNMMNLLRKRGHQVELAIFNNERSILYDNLEQANFKIHIIGSNYKNIYDLRRIPTLRKLIKQFDVIHSHTSPAQILTSVASIGLKQRLITTEHSSYNRRRNKVYLRPLERFVYKRYNTIVGCSKDATDSLKSHIPEFSNKIITISNGVNVKNIEEATPSNDIKKCKNGIINIIMVGRFEHPKDQITLVKALRYLPDKIHVYFVGDGIDRKHVEEAVNNFGVVSRTHFLGIRGDIPNLLKSVDIAVHSSHWEGLPLSILEEMAAGCPVIASNSKGISSIVDGAGLLFSPGDDKDLAHQVLKLQNDKKLYDEVKIKCKDRAWEYDIENMIDKYINLYELGSTRIS